ncbi:MAG: haloacid dehalogenase, partial [Natronospirillum sp.]
MNHIDFDQASVLFTDVDDTLTTAGRLLPETYQAICNLAAAGVDIIPVTGGCAGWCDQIIRTWPVKSVIGEGGAFYVEHTAQRAIRWHYWQTPAQHQLDQIRILEAVRQLDLGFYPILARDQSFRLVDVAIDYHQDQR